MSNKTKLSAKEFIDQYPKAIPEKRIDWEGAMVDYANYCLNFPTIPQGEPKTDEEILNAMLKMNWDNEYAEDGVISKSDALKLASIARASERAEGIAEQKEINSPTWEAEPNLLFKIINAIGHSDLNVLPEMQLDLDEETQSLATEICRIFESEQHKLEVPQCLQECRLTNAENNEIFSSASKYAPHARASAENRLIQEKMLEKFSLLLSQVKGLPTWDDLMKSSGIIFDNANEEEAGKVVTKWLTENFSLLLLQRDEAHKAEKVDFLHYVLNLEGGSKRTVSKSLCEDYLKAFDLFLKKKEGRSETKTGGSES